ncbi:hypothetical protein [Kribbella sp. NPDC048928]|uniref:hypothetical protein n=1 Tax=Kribbella sp. NPDC048928 TaxID=3364111 RepID=UPI00371D062C
MSSAEILRELLRTERRARSFLATKRARWAGDIARVTLLAAAERGDPDVVRVLAGPPPHQLFEAMWRDYLLRDFDHGGAASRRLEERVGGRDDITSALAELVRFPAADLLTHGMRRVVPVAAAFGRHRLAQIAQAKILAAGDQDLVDEICHLAGELPSLGEFCRRHLLAPSDPRDRRLYWLLTAQVELYRATDPDGSFARSTYAEADSLLRYHLRRAVAEGCLFDLVRSFADSDGTHLPADDDVLLWEQITKSTTARAVTLADRLGKTWQPERPRDQRLLAAFRAAPAELVTAIAEDPGLLELLRFESSALRVGMGWSHAAGFLEMSDGGHRIDIVSIPDGQLRRRQAVETVGTPYRLVPCSSAAAVWVDDAGLWSASPDGQTRLSPNTRLRLLATAEGWAAVSSSELLIGTGDGRLSRSVRLTELGLNGRSVPGLAVSGNTLLLTEPQNHFVVTHDGALHAVVRPKPLDSHWTSADEPLVVPGGDLIATHEARGVEVRFYHRDQRARDERAAILQTLNHSWISSNLSWISSGPSLRNRLLLLPPYSNDPCADLLRAVSEES